MNQVNLPLVNSAKRGIEVLSRGAGLRIKLPEYTVLEVPGKV